MGRVRSARRVVFGHGHEIAGTVYGTIIVMSIITAGAQGVDHHASRLAVVTVTTVVVLWFAHVYAHALGEGVAVGRRLDRATLARIALREGAIPLAAVLPTLALLLAATGIAAERTGIRLALGVGVLTLGVEGYRYARIERIGRAGTLLSVSANLAIGLTIVALEVAIAH